MWHVTGDTWHVTRDMWHLTCDMFRGVNILSNFQLPSSYRLWFMILWRFGGKGWLNESVNDKAVYRTAPATPGLLNRVNGRFHVKGSRKKVNVKMWISFYEMWMIIRQFDVFGRLLKNLCDFKVIFLAKKEKFPCILFELQLLNQFWSHNLDF